MNKVIKYFILLLVLGIIFIPSKIAKYEKDNKEIILADSSTPKLITPFYNTNHFVIADYVVSPSSGDMTSKINSALNNCKSKKGGTVWLERGIYNVSSPITIPSGCTLMGDWQDPDNYQGTLDYGTKIVVDVKKFTKDGDIDNTGLFKLAPSSGVEGLTIYYKNQNAYNPTPQPWTFYYHNGMLKSIKNITLINSYQGIGRGLNETSAHEMLMIENVKGTVLQKGVIIHNSSDVGTITGLTLTPNYLANANFSAFGDSGSIDKSKFVTKLKERNGTGMIITDAEQSQYVNITLSGFRFGIQFPNASLVKTRYMGSGSFYNLKISDCKEGIRGDSGYYKDKNTTIIDYRWGYVITNSSITGSDYAILNDSTKIGSKRGTIKLNDVTIKGSFKIGETILYNTGNSYVSPAVNVDQTGKINNSGRFSNLNLYRKLKNNGSNFTYLPAGSNISKINSTLSSVSSSGGGVVYLEPGVYRVDKSIVIPSNVELRGSSSSPSRLYSVGTTLNVVSNVKAVIINGNNSGVYGVNIIYENNIKKLASGPSYDNYAYSIVAENVNNVYVKNVSIAGASHGIYLNKVKQFAIENIVTGVLKNAIRVDNSSNGLIMNCLQNGSVICRNGLFSIDESKANFNYIMNPNTKKNMNYIYLTNDTNIELQNDFTYGAYNFVTAINSTVYSVNTGYDGGTGVYYDTNNTKLVLINGLKMAGTTIRNSGGNVGTYNIANINDINEKDIVGNIFKVSKLYINPYLKISSSVTLTSSSKKEISYIYDGDGKLSCTSADEKIAKCSINTNNKTIVITPVANNKTVKLTITAKAGVNYSSASKTITVTTNYTSALKGDVNGDNKVDNLDYVKIRSHITKIHTLTGEEKKRADVDGKNGIDNMDYVLVRNIILGK